jgi:hypothetical protein
MDVWVKEQGLRPGVQHRDCAGRRSQPSLAYGVERADGALEEQRVAAALISQEKRMQLRRHGEDQVEIRHGEQLALLRLDPSRLLQTLALGAVSVSTRVVERLLAATVIAHLKMAAQKRRSTPQNVSDHSRAFPPKLGERRRMRPENFRQV